jgi:hypothetical protein
MRAGLEVSSGSVDGAASSAPEWSSSDRAAADRRSVANQRALPAALGAAFLGVIGVLGGCGRRAEVELEPPRRVADRLRIAASDAERHGFVEASSMPGSARGATTAAPNPGIDFDVPDDWQRKPATTMRLASFTAPGDVDVSLTVLGGGSLQGNVDRWREQMGLPPVDEAGLNALPRAKAFGRDDAVIVDLVGRYVGGTTPIADARMLAAVAAHEGRFVFVKMTGERAAVDAARASFVAFVESLRGSTPPAAPGGAAPGGVPTGSVISGGATSGAGRLAWRAPAGWSTGAARELRVVTLHPGGDTSTHAYLVILGGEAGGVAANFARWCGQVGASELDAAALDALPRIQMLGASVSLLESYGPKEGVVGAVARLGGDSLFAKLTGPKDAVRAARDGFVEFCQSVVLR